MNADHVILGKGCVYSSDSAKTGLNNNIIVCGSSGCGKTMSISEPALLTAQRRSLITVVTKRRIIEKYKPLLESRGYEVSELNFVTPAQGDVGYDPLRFVCSYEDITFLAESIVNSDKHKVISTADPYWDSAAVSLLSAEIAYVLTTKDDATFADVLALQDSLTIEESGSGIRTNMDAEFEQIGDYAVSQWRTFAKLPMRTAGCVFSSLNTVLNKMFTRDIRKIMTCSRQVDLENLATKKSVLFVTTSPVNSALHCYINLFYGHVFKQLFEFAEEMPDAKLPVPVHVLCDDFATGCKILNFPEYISIFREKQISVTLLLQSESQLESIYGPSDATTIINNCDSYVYMGGMDITTAERVSRRLDCALDDVLYMPVGRLILFRRGQRPIVTERYNILENKQYQLATKHYNESIHQNMAVR